MPPSLRRRAEPPLPPSPEQEQFSESEDEFVEGVGEDDEEGMVQGMQGMGAEDEEEEEHLASPTLNDPTSHIPPHYREISTLASWTASSSKPGCSIPQLRHPSTSLFWQSDGPQPHYLNIHFFKLVRIVGLRLYLDFEADESYTPTKIVLLAGSGMNDLQEWGEMRLESPRGWVWADFEGVGDLESDEEDEDEDEEMDDGNDGQGLGIRGHATHDISDSENAAPRPLLAATPSAPDPMNLTPQQPHLLTSPIPPQNPYNQTPTLPRPTPRHPFAALSANTTPQAPALTPKKPKTPVLRCHLVQIKIMENHQNGKDTHLRGLQIFAKDKEVGGEKRGLVSGNGVAGRDTNKRGESSGFGFGESGSRGLRGITKSEWMAEPAIR